MTPLNRRLATSHLAGPGFFAVALLVMPVLPASADVITQMSPQGRQVVLQRDAIVVKQDSASITFKHFDLKQRRVVKVVLQESSLPYGVDRSAPDARKQIVDLWRRFGYAATVTDTAGKATRVYDAYIDFYPAGGSGSLLDSVPARTDFPMSLESGGADLAEFEDVAKVEVEGDHLRVTLANGQVKQGRFLMPSSKQAEARFLGITEHYDPSSEDVFDFALPLARIKQIDFER